MSRSYAGAARIGLNQPAGRLTFRKRTKKRKPADREPARWRIAQPARCQTACDAGEERGRGDHEPGRVNQRHLHDQSNADPGKALHANACSPRSAGSSGTRARKPPVNTSVSNHTLSKISPAEMILGTKFGPMRA